MDSQMFLAITVVLTLIIAGYALFRSYQTGGTVDATTIVGTLEASVEPAQELATVVGIAVDAAEQMKREGTIDTNEQALNYAIDYIQKYFPAVAKLENEKIIGAIKAAVLAASYVTSQINANKQSELTDATVEESILNAGTETGPETHSTQ